MYKTFILILMIKYGKPELEGFIIGGEYVNINKYPHAVHLHMYSKNVWICGGSILNQNIVVTAAHCFDEYIKNYKMIIKFGDHSLKSSKSAAMKSFKLHENYDKETLYNDIALVSSKTALKLGQSVKRIAILKSPPSLNAGFVSGWGIINNSDDGQAYWQLNRQIWKSLRHDIRKFNTNHIKNTTERNKGSKVFARDVSIGLSQLTKLKTDDGSVASTKGEVWREHERERSQYLKHTSQQIQTPRVCGYLGNVPTGAFCAGPISGVGHPDAGDSGSGLIVSDYILIGLVSYKSPEYSLVVYTNVSYFYNWIKKNAAATYCG